MNLAQVTRSVILCWHKSFPVLAHQTFFHDTSRTGFDCPHGSLVTDIASVTRYVILCWHKSFPVLAEIGNVIYATKCISHFSSLLHPVRQSHTCMSCIIYLQTTSEQSNFVVTHTRHTHTHTQTHAYTRTHTYKHTHIRTHTQIHTNTDTHRYKHPHTQIHTSTHTCTIMLQNSRTIHSQRGPYGALVQ